MPKDLTKFVSKAISKAEAGMTRTATGVKGPGVIAMNAGEDEEKGKDPSHENDAKANNTHPENRVHVVKPPQDRVVLPDQKEVKPRPTLESLLDSDEEPGGTGSIYAFGNKIFVELEGEWPVHARRGLTAAIKRAKRKWLIEKRKEVKEANNV